MGGLAALYAHYRRPDVFGAALCMSPSLWFAEHKIYEHIAAQPLPWSSRIYLDAGQHEGDMLGDAKRLALQLRQRGYDDNSGPNQYDDDDSYDESPDDYRAEQRAARYASATDQRSRRAGPPPRTPRRRRYRLRRFFALLALAVIAYVVAMIIVIAQIWGSIATIDSTPNVADRPSGGAGESYLLVGTDSRDQLTAEQQDTFGTGYTEGSRADTVMLLHVPTMGEPTLVSLPRDSYVNVRDHGANKLNSAHSLGGPALLVDTVEQATGLRINGYLEIGFGGFVGVVDKVDGVNLCLDAPIKDEKAHIDLPAGCQDLTGPDALGYVRMRYSDNRGDLGRVERQRAFLSALVTKMARPSTILNPYSLHQVGTATGSALARGEDTSMLEMSRIALAMRAVANGKGHSITVPLSNVDYRTNVGSTVLWNEKGAADLFTALRNGDPITVQP